MPAPSIIEGTTMDYYAGIDVSLESSSLCVVDVTGRVGWCNIPSVNCCPVSVAPLGCP
jgi:hypothetical protein